MKLITEPQRIHMDIKSRGFSAIRGTDLNLGRLKQCWRQLTVDWEFLETDAYMTDNGRYRRRRYGRFFFLPATGTLKRLPHATVFQSQAINNFAGGIHRDFAPLRELTFKNPCLLELIRFDFSCFAIAESDLILNPWEVWIHQIRIETFGNVDVSPAPEGIHHDGHDLIAMHLVARKNVDGGLSRIYDNSRTLVYTCLLETGLDTIYADDHRVMHSVDPIRPLNASEPAHRDILIIDFDHKPCLAEP